MLSDSAPSFQIVNDVHSALNPTRVRVHRPSSVEDVCRIVRNAADAGSRIAICGGRHAMGGQQFASDSELIDLRTMSRILEFDEDRGLVRAEAGIQWPELIQGVLVAQSRFGTGRPPRWGIAQKQTGADALTLGGSLSANVHGRGLLMAPIVADVEAFSLVSCSGECIRCSRVENAELFSLAIGGYGLFGVIVDVTLRLAQRQTLRRTVRVIDIEDAVNAAERRIREGYIYGDFQFDIDARSPDFLTKGVFSGYVPVEGDPQPPPEQRSLSREDWVNLLTLAHANKGQAFTRYAQHYIATDGQLYHSDTHQLSEYLDDYHLELDRRLGAEHRGSEIITELYVPPERLVEFLRAAAKSLVEKQAQVIYGTIRLIQPDAETLLAWARSRFACVIFNLHVDHVDAAVQEASAAFRALIDLAIEAGGSFYLTYHRFATAEQVRACYPRIDEFFASKRRYDPNGTFTSDWYRHYAPHFPGAPE